MVYSSPLVSIGMPVRNCQETLHLALGSLLAQTYTQWELLLIDDGSSDGSLEIVKKFSDPRIKINSDGKFKGIINRLNQAISMSQGKYFARMDGDDVSYPERLQRQVDYLERYIDIDLVGTRVMVFNHTGNPLGKRVSPERHSVICAKPFSGFPIAHPTYVGRIEWFRKYGYRQGALRCEDQDLLLRSYRSSRFANIPEILLGYREDKVQLKKILKGRWYFGKTVANEYFRRRQLGIGLGAVLEQILKGMVDCIAVTSGLNYRLLRHRAQPITDEERKQWEHVWRLVNSDEIRY
jgi:glycosyltransferase involved in cell wall biosynthesis